MGTVPYKEIRQSVVNLPENQIIIPHPVRVKAMSPDHGAGKRAERPGIGSELAGN